MDSKMSKKAASFFAKKGEKGLAAHERREAAGKEEDTPAIAKREEKALRGAPAGLRNYERKEHKEMGMKRGGMACGGMARGGGVERKGKTDGKMVKMAKGGSYSYSRAPVASGIMGMPQPPKSTDAVVPAARPKKYAKGGSVSSRADGIASKGKTNCKTR